MATVKQQFGRNVKHVLAVERVTRVCTLVSDESMRDSLCGHKVPVVLADAPQRLFPKDSIEASLVFEQPVKIPVPAELPLHITGGTQPRKTLSHGRIHEPAKHINHDLRVEVTVGQMTSVR